MNPYPTNTQAEGKYESDRFNHRQLVTINGKQIRQSNEQLTAGSTPLSNVLMTALPPQPSDTGVNQIQLYNMAQHLWIDEVLIYWLVVNSALTCPF